MTLKEKILQTFIVTMREINRHGGAEKFFEKYPAGGMFYLQSMDEDIENKVETGTRTCLKHLNECKKYSKHPLLVCADGVPLQGQTISAEASSLAASRSEEDAYNFGKMIGMRFNANGVDWVLGPSIDMYYDRSMPLYAISDDPELTARLYRMVVRGIQDQGVCATVKHFPGLGTNNINMHFAPGQNVLPFDEWMNSYGYTYKEMFKENVCSVMTTHVALKSYDSEFHDGFYPIATFSEKLTTELLKEKLGFEGAVVTDALCMGGMATGDLIAETVQAFKAGADLLLWPPVEAADAIAAAIESGEIPMSRLDDALERIGKMREFINKNKAKADTPSAEFCNEISEKIIRNGICLVRNDIGLIPIKDRKNILIIDATDGDDSAGMLCEELNCRGYSAEVKRIIYDVDSNVCWQGDVDKLRSEYDLVIFNINTSISCSWSEPFMLIWASHLFDKSKKLILNYGSPFFAQDYFPEDPTVINTHTPANKTVIAAVADGIEGKAEFTGKTVIREK